MPLNSPLGPNFTTAQERLATHRTKVNTNREVNLMRLFVFDITNNTSH